MATITTYEILEQLIEKTEGRPKILEALWDGDTNGWYIYLNLYSETGSFFWTQEKITDIGTVSFGGDIRLFNGEVPAWPEAVLVKEWGQKAAKKYGLTFYFPSEKEPECDCPSWHQRHLAIACADCNKLIIPTDSPYLPKEVCYNCHLIREQNDRIKHNSVTNGGVSIYLEKDNKHEQAWYSTNVNDSSLFPFASDFVSAQLTDKIVDIITLDKNTLYKLRNKLEKALFEKLDTYEKPSADEERKPARKRYTITYKENTYEYTHQHGDILDLTNHLKTVEKAILEGYSYKLLFKKGISYRADTILRFVNFAKKGKAPIIAINDKYKGILTEQEIFDTLQTLVQLEALTIHENDVNITTMGQWLV